MPVGAPYNKRFLPTQTREVVLLGRPTAVTRNSGVLRIFLSFYAFLEMESRYAYQISGSRAIRDKT
jgi:hypothetical protein